MTYKFHVNHIIPNKPKENKFQMVCKINPMRKKCEYIFLSITMDKRKFTSSVNLGKFGK